jgi:hypothetical protein
MRKIQLLGVLLALFSFGALTATSAMATTLLAEWLLNGVAIAADNLVEIDGELLLEDTKAILGSPAAVLCSGILDGFVEPASRDTVTELLSLNGEGTDLVHLTSNLSLDCVAQTGCETNTPVLVYAVGLPWESEVELVEQTGGPFFADFLKTKANGGNFGWEITNCLVLGTAHEDECTVKEGVAELKLEGTALLGIFSKAFTILNGLKIANCTAGGAETGEVAEPGTFLVATGELSASSEGMEA